MGLQINNNLEAMDTLRQLSTAQMAFSKSLQRLSSGKRINSAADDAAGYAISQKLLAQSNGLNQASANAQDGISLVQTANGGLQTIQDMLQRLRQLAVQSANDTNTTSDRTALQNEADQLNQEITQIASTTQFNSKSLLEGSLASTGAFTSGTIGNLAGVTASNATINGGTLTSATYALTVTTAGTQAKTNAGAGLGAGTGAAGADYIGDSGATSVVASSADAVQVGSHTLTIAGALGSATINLVAGTASGMTYNDVVNAINAASGQTGVQASFDATSGAAGLVLSSTKAGTAQNFTVTGDVASTLTGLGLQASGGSATTATVTAGTNGVATLSGGSITGTLTLTGQGNVFSDAGTGLSIDLSASTTLANGSTANLVVTNSAANLQVGANANQSIAVNIGDMRSQALGIQSATNSNSAIDISQGGATAATAAISVIDTAISKVSSQAALLGAVQNRLSEAMNNLAIGAENLTASYSAITNVNMAQETTNLATQQILQQSSTAMLAQANQAPQGILKLLG